MLSAFLTPIARWSLAAVGPFASHPNGGRNEGALGIELYDGTSVDGVRPCDEP